MARMEVRWIVMILHPRRPIRPEHSPRIGGRRFARCSPTHETRRNVVRLSHTQRAERAEASERCIAGSGHMRRKASGAFAPCDLRIPASAASQFRVPSIRPSCALTWIRSSLRRSVRSLSVHSRASGHRGRKRPVGAKSAGWRKCFCERHASPARYAFHRKPSICHAVGSKFSRRSGSSTSAATTERRLTTPSRVSGGIGRAWRPWNASWAM